ncbi:hypothetical protein QVM62_18485 [Pseudomonas putida]|uniref:hypothetical protein n=1 Tax=Pseudomonas TaxID=286 RepID=UPI003525C8C3
MLRSLLFQVEEDVEVSSNGVSHGVVSCLQWKSPNLAPLEVAAKQTLALMWRGRLDDEVLNVLETAHIHGALAPVRLIAARADVLHLFLADGVSSKTLPAAEALWEKVKDVADVQSWAVHFMKVSEIMADQTADDFCVTAKEILRLHDLGLANFEGSAKGNQLHCYQVPAMCVTDNSQWYQHVLSGLEKDLRRLQDLIVERDKALNIDKG